MAGVVAAEAAEDAAPEVTVRWRGALPGGSGPGADWQEVVTPELQGRRRIRLWQRAGEGGRHLWMRYSTLIGQLDFRIGPGAATVDVHWPDSVGFADIQSYFVGPVFAALLRWRGDLCLHASVVARQGHAVMIVGNKGRGKSTTAAALVRGGWHLVADDVGVLSIGEGGILVHPAYPRLRLSPAATEGLFGGDPGLQPVYSHVEKRYLDLGADPSKGGFSDRAVPLAAVFFLGPRGAGGAARIARMGAPESLVALSRNTIGNYVVFDAAARARDFERLGHLARTVPHFSLSCPNDVTALPVLGETLLRHALSGRVMEWSDAHAQGC